MKEDFKSISERFFILVKIEDENESVARLESALYSAGRPLSIEELIRASGTESRIKTLNLVEKLIHKAKTAFKAIEIEVSIFRSSSTNAIVCAIEFSSFCFNRLLFLYSSCYYGSFKAAYGQK